MKNINEKMNEYINNGLAKNGISYINNDMPMALSYKLQSVL